MKKVSLIATLGILITTLAFSYFSGGYNNPVQSVEYGTVSSTTGASQSQIEKIYTVASTAVAQQVTVQTTASASNSLVGKFFKVYPAGNKYPFIFWMNVDGLSRSPNTIGYASYEIDVAATDTAAQVATKIAAGYPASGLDFTISALGNTVTIVNKKTGAATAPDAWTTDYTVATSVLGVDSNYCGKAFKIWSASNAHAYNYWFNVSGYKSSCSFTAEDGFVSKEIDIASGASANTIASAISTALNLESASFSASPSSNIVTITEANEGPANMVWNYTSPVKVEMTTLGTSSDKTIIGPVAANGYSYVSLTSNTTSAITGSPTVTVYVSPLDSGDDTWVATTATIVPATSLAGNVYTAPVRFVGKRVKAMTSAATSAGGATIYMTLSNY